MRIEKDSMGELPVPDEAYYGIQTVRSLANYDVTDRTYDDYPCMVRAMAEVKKACAITNRNIEALDASKAQAIIQACDEIIAGRFAGQFPVKVSRGAGTSFNMNVNEVIANRANEILTGTKGYVLVHPNNHVNMCQSSNDTMPTVENIVLYRESGAVAKAARTLEDALAQKTLQFADVVRVGRTALQDAVPMTLGQVFAGFRGGVRRNRRLLEAFRETYRQVVIGGTVLGTGIGILPGYYEQIHRNLSVVLGFEVLPPSGTEGEVDLIPNEHMFVGMQNPDHFLIISGYLKSLACVAGKIANDLRLLASGPDAGFGEIELPAPGGAAAAIAGDGASLCEWVSGVAQQVSAGDWATTMSVTQCDADIASGARVAFDSVLDSLLMLRTCLDLFAGECVRTITANVETCRNNAEHSTSLATMVSTLYGYEVGTRIARLAYAEGMTCKEAALKEGLIEPDAAEELFDVRRLSQRERTVEMFAKYGKLRRVK